MYWIVHVTIQRLDCNYSVLDCTCNYSTVGLYRNYLTYGLFYNVSDCNYSTVDYTVSISSLDYLTMYWIVTIQRLDCSVTFQLFECNNLKVILPIVWIVLECFNIKTKWGKQIGLCSYSLNTSIKTPIWYLMNINIHAEGHSHKLLWLWQLSCSMHPKCAAHPHWTNRTCGKHETDVTLYQISVICNFGRFYG